MNLGWLVIFGSAWGMFIVLSQERPDLLYMLPVSAQHNIHIGLAIVLVISSIQASWAEIIHSARPLVSAPAIIMRNVLILLAGVALCSFVAHELLTGIDPTGHRKLW